MHDAGLSTELKLFTNISGSLASSSKAPWAFDDFEYQIS